MNFKKETFSNEQKIIKRTKNKKFNVKTSIVVLNSRIHSIEK